MKLNVVFCSILMIICFSGCFETSERSSDLNEPPESHSEATGPAPLITAGQEEDIGPSSSAGAYNAQPTTSVSPEDRMGNTDTSQWELIWSDEFNYDGLPDPDKWAYEVGFVRNQEAQYYMKGRLENTRVEDGYLILEGRKERIENPRIGPEWEDWQKDRDFVEYTSGSIHTLGKFDFTYGRVEVRARVPRGDGVWPAIWTLGSNFPSVNWPRCGEIDIMEYVGKEPNAFYGNAHFADPDVSDKAVHRQAGGGRIAVPAPWEDFHVFALEWDTSEMRYFVDGKRFYTVEVDSAGEGLENPFRKPHYIILNLALGGAWGGPIDDSMFPQRFTIDYIRVFQNKAN